MTRYKEVLAHKLSNIHLTIKENAMIVNVITQGNISFVLVFIEGLLSFFSPCILPLLPVYMTLLAGKAKEEKDGIIYYKRKTVFLHTLFFILGISFAFFILGMTFTTLGNYFVRNKAIFTRIGGIIIIILGLFQLGIFDFKFLQKERRINNKILEKKMNPIVAFITGFTFSFAWTPCIGPMLSSVLILASSSKDVVVGNLLVIIYTLGFTIPFLILGLFTTKILEFLNKKKKLLKYTIKAGGLILVLIGIMTFTGWLNGVSGYLNSLTNKFATEKTKEDEEKEDSSEGANVLPAIDFTLEDQYGNNHTLSDYKGKVVFLNFWATWCPPCKKEMPDIEKLYKEYNYNQDDVVILGIAEPKNDNNKNTREVSKEGIIEFLDENGYTFPTVFDETGEVFSDYYIQAFPTTFFIDKEGNMFGYYPGMMTESIMRSNIEGTLNAVR